MPAMSEAIPKTVDPLEAGRDALGRHAWREAYDQLALADREGRLTGDDLEAMAMAAFFIARADEELSLKERAFKARESEGDTVRAAYLALDLARNYFYAGKPSIASGWTRRAERSIGPDGETYVHGYLAIIRSEAAAAAGDVETALAEAQRAITIGEGASNADLRAFAQSNLGVLKIASGDTKDGFALMEEASFAAVNGELSPFTTGVTACRMIGACRDLTDYKRASEWIEQTERYCDRESLSGFPGVCRVHRAEVAAVGGAWERAEQELERATGELGAYNAVPPQADGYYAIGDIRRLRGDFEGARSALKDAHARGRTPQPALALIQLAEGEVKDASAAINAAVADETWDQWARARLLPAQAEIAIAAGNLILARFAADELNTIVTGYPSPALVAGGRVALGRVLLAEGDAAGAARELRAAIKLWLEVGAPYEVARARALLSRALRALEDDGGADLELNAAIDEFQRLGARIDLESAERELREAEERRSGPVTVRMTFMFTDIVDSTRLAEERGNTAWERLLHWHDGTLLQQVAEGDGKVVKSTGDGIFAAFESARAAVDCAISIQQALRHSPDSELRVRIGMHTSEANRRGTDYSGKGIHVAARVAAIAEGGEILATAETLEEAGDVGASEPRLTPVKGVTEPVSIATVRWS